MTYEHSGLWSLWRSSNISRPLSLISEGIAKLTFFRTLLWVSVYTTEVSRGNLLKMAHKVELFEKVLTLWKQTKINFSETQLLLMQTLFTVVSMFK